MFYLYEISLERSVDIVVRNDNFYYKDDPYTDGTLELNERKLIAIFDIKQQAEEYKAFLKSTAIGNANSIYEIDEVLINPELPEWHFNLRKGKK